MTAADPFGTVLVGLADPTRRQILSALASRGSSSASALAADLPVSRQAVLKHLAVLSRAGLVSAHRSGREVRYRVCPQTLDATGQWMVALGAEWDQRLQAIKRVAESAGRMTPGSDPEAPAEPVRQLPPGSGRR